MPSQSRSITIGGAIVLGLLLGSCGKDQPQRSPLLPTPPPSPPTASVIRLELRAPSSIPPGESAQLTANVIKSDGSVENISSQAQWTSSNARVLEVSSAGVARAIANGEAFINVRYQSRSASTRVFVLPTGTYRLSGQVTDSGFGIGGVTLTVLSGIGEGLIAITDGTGNYALYGVSGHVRIQAKKDGYFNRLEELDVANHRTFGFELIAERARTNLSGTYTLNLSAACAGSSTLPDAARTRAYTAILTQDGGRLSVALSGADFIVTRGRGDHFAGYVDPNDLVSFAVGDAYYYYYYYGQFDVVERFSASSALVVNGTVTAKATPSSISGTLTGAINLTQGTTPPFTRFSAYCYGNAHRFEMVRR